jgi:hypothetical protein
MLSWLLEQASKVYDWFSNSYWGMVDKLQNFWSYLSSAIRSVTGPLTLWAQGLVNNVKTWATMEFTAAYNTVSGWVAAAKAWAAGEIEVAKSWLKTQIDAVATWWAALLKTVQDQWTLTIHNIELGLRELIDKGLAALRVLINPILKLFQPLENLLKFFTQDILGKLNIFLTTLYKSLVVFFANPLKFIFNLIWGRFLEFLSFVLGYGMGTLKYSLPPIPDWFGGGGDDGWYYSPGELNAPCTPVYISGYTFNNPPGHHGVDLGIVDAQEIYAAHDGVIESAGWSTVGYGNNVTISGGEWWTRYAHLQQIIVGLGQAVQRGQLIAYGDTTGASTGNHLHFEVKHNGVFIDPMGVI